MPDQNHDEQGESERAQRAVFAVVVVFIALFGGLTATALLEWGVNVLTVCSVAVFALLAIGVLGALKRPPDSGR